MPRHTFKPGEKEAVAAVLGIDPQMLPDDLELEPEDDEDEEYDSEVEEEESDDSNEEEDEDEELDEEDEDEDSEEDVEHLKLLDEWRKDYAKDMPFSEFLKNRGK